MGATVTPDLKQEFPFFVDAGGETVFGIFTRVGNPDAPGVAIMSGGLTGTSTIGRNRMFVRLARDLAGRGYHSIRLDYHGMGESTGTIEEFRLDAEQPFVDDIVGAVRWMQDQGVSRVIAVGKCFGSRMTLSSTPHIDALDGVVLIGPPVRDFGKGEKSVARLANELTMWGYFRRACRVEVAKGLFDPRRRRAYKLAARAKLRVVKSRIRRTRVAAGTPNDSSGVSRKFIEPLEDLVRRRVPVQFVYGDEDEFYAEFLKAKAGRLGRVLEQAGPLVEVTVLSGQVRGFAQGQVQDGIIDAARDWICRLEPQRAAASPG